eukprot:434709-Pyramimonas_sp.AAC.1
MPALVPLRRKEEEDAMPTLRPLRVEARGVVVVATTSSEGDAICGSMRAQPVVQWPSGGPVRCSSETE